jgi:hypothetical protein
VLVLGLLTTHLPAAGGERSTLQTPRHAALRNQLYAITLPDAAPELPDGPNQQEFQALCRLCHSTRLVLTQPRFPEKKWAEIVHKMVVVYGAPLDSEQEQAIVAYLVTIRGAQP